MKFFFEIIIDIKSNLFHFYKFDCKIYSFNNIISKKEKFKKRAYVDHLLQYDETNIYFIWIFNQRKVVRIKNVTFDEIIFYNSANFDISQFLKNFMIERFVEVSSVANFDKITELEFDLNLNVMNINKNKSSKEKKMKISSSKILHLLFISEFESKSKHHDVNIFNQEAFANMNRSNANSMRSKDSNLFNQQRTSESIKSSKSRQKSSFSFFSILNINERKSFTSEQISASKRRFTSSFQTSHNIRFDIDELNILSEKIKKRIKKQAHAIFLEKAKFNQLIAFQGAFSCYIFSKSFYDNNKKLFSAIYIDQKVEFKKLTFFSSIFSISKFHRDNILSESINYKQMFKDQHFSEFMQTVKMKINQLTIMKIWKKILFNKKLLDKISISLIWIFKYKFDDQRYFIEYKARLCVKENLQHIEQNIFAVTLTIRIFRALITIVAAFDFEIK